MNKYIVAGLLFLCAENAALDRYFDTQDRLEMLMNNEIEVGN